MAGTLASYDAALKQRYLGGERSAVVPARSRKQFRMMKGIASGSIPPRGGLSRAKAREFVRGQSPKGLPNRKGTGDSSTLDRYRRSRRSRKRRRNRS